jgi:Na+-translocating ferredoxin:NAD+ oxidoreductase RnfD subunit
MHFMAALFPVAAGLTFFGWRAAVAILLVCGSAMAGIAIWRRIGARGEQLSYPHALWLALLLAMMLPAHLAAGHGELGSQTRWFLLPAAGIMLAIFLWLPGGLGAGRIHPVLITYLLIAVLSTDLLVPHFVLQRQHLLRGNLLNGNPPDARLVETEPWYSRTEIIGQDAKVYEPASMALSRYILDGDKPAGGVIPIHNLLRDDLPPLEDLIVGGHPSPIGAGSAIGVIIGGLFLLYCGLIDFRIPLIIIVVELAALLILPIPTGLHGQTTWYWIAARHPGIGWGTGITFANYQIMASPVLFMAFFLATSPSVRPMSRRARVIYAILIGAGSAALQLYMGMLLEILHTSVGTGLPPASFQSVAVGPYVALVAVSLLTPLLDRWFHARPLV